MYKCNVNKKKSNSVKLYLIGNKLETNFRTTKLPFKITQIDFM